MDVDTAARHARFEQLVTEVYEPLQRYALRRCPAPTVDDVVADTLLVLWRRLDDVPDGAALPWTYRVAAQTLANHRRGAARLGRLRTRIAAVDPPRPVVEGPEVPDRDLHEALGHLPEADQEVLRLWAWEQLTPAEIAVVMDVTANAVSIRLHRAKARLAEALERQEAVPDTGAARTREVT